MRMTLHKAAQPRPRAAGGEDAPGLPDRSEMGDLGRMRDIIGKMAPYVIQQHKADRAGPHYDLRLEGPEGLYSWAVPRTNMPESGSTRLALRQPLHTPEYKDFEGTIEEGYGKGDVETEQQGRAMITSVEGDPPRAIDFTLSGRHPERYRLQKGDDGDWMLIGTTPTKGPGEDKKHFKRVEEGDQLDEMVSQVSSDRPMTAKIDGARTLMKFMKDKAELMSHRTRSDTGGPILHTERVAPELLQRGEIPVDLQGKTLLGELYATRPGDDGREVLRPSQISGMLNSTIERARRKAEDEDIDWNLALFGQAGEESPEPEKLRELVEAARGVAPDLVTTPPQATTPEQAREMLEAIQSGKHPLTEEGAVFDTGDGKVKYKPTEESDVIVRGITPGTGRNKETMGALEYALTPGGDVAGKVGTGLSDAMREEIAANPEEWIDRVARIKAQQQLPSGAFRAPRLLGFHEDYGPGRWGPEIRGRMEKASGNVESFIKQAREVPEPDEYVQPRRFLRRYYGNNLPNAISQAREYQNSSQYGSQKPNSPVTPMSLSRETFDREVPVYDSTFDDINLMGHYDPRIGITRANPTFTQRVKRQILSSNSPYTEKNRQETMSHELAHAMDPVLHNMNKGNYQPDINREAFTPSLHGIQRQDSDTLNPHETMAELSRIKRLYHKNTGNLVTNPEEARRAMQWARENSDEYLFGGLLGAVDRLRPRDDAQEMESISPRFEGDPVEEYKKKLYRAMPGLVRHNRGQETKRVKKAGSGGETKPNAHNVQSDLGRKMRVLMTGFDPLEGETSNASGHLLEHMKKIQDRPYELSTETLPVDREKAVGQLGNTIKDYRPDMIVGAGENPISWWDRIPLIGDDTPVKVERRAGDLDNKDEIVDDIKSQLDRSGVTTRLSDDAGDWVCEHVYERMLQDGGTPSVFLHIASNMDPENRMKAVSRAVDDFVRQNMAQWNAERTMNKNARRSQNVREFLKQASNPLEDMDEEDKRKLLSVLAGGALGAVGGWAMPYAMGREPVEGPGQFIPAGVGLGVGGLAGYGASQAGDILGNVASASENADVTTEELKALAESLNRSADNTEEVTDVAADIARLLRRGGEGISYEAGIWGDAISDIASRFGRGAGLVADQFR